MEKDKGWTVVFTVAVLYIVGILIAGTVLGLFA